MWLRVIFLLFLFPAWFASARAHPRQSAYHAQAMLGPEVWSEVIKIKNEQPTCGFPSVVYALVFEFEDRLWFYSENAGTESLSRERGKLAEDKRAFGPLLREIHAGYQRYEILSPDYTMTRKMAARDLPQGCFIDAVVYYHALLEAGEVLEDARLLAYYADDSFGFPGHSLLYFEKDGQRFYYDATESKTPRELAAGVPTDALSIARATLGGSIFLPPKRAKFLPLKIPVPAIHEPKAHVLLASRPD